jgi:hypothetical protein
MTTPNHAIFNSKETEEAIAAGIALYADYTGDDLSYNSAGYLQLGGRSAVPIIALGCFVVVQTAENEHGVRQITVEVHPDESLSHPVAKLAVDEHEIATWRAIHDWLNPEPQDS